MSLPQINRVQERNSGSGAEGRENPCMEKQHYLKPQSPGMLGLWPSSSAEREIKISKTGV